MCQFQSLLAQLGKRLAWDVQLAGLTAGVKPNMEDHPLSPTKGRFQSKEKGTPEDLGAFLNRLNSFGKGVLKS